jgi:hypothetical protein
MWDVRDQIAACFRPPAVANGTRLTFYFSLKMSGEEFGRLRTTWFGYRGTEDRRKLMAGFAQDFVGCLQLSLTPSLARTIPGKVYLLQYQVATDGRFTTVLRPFGSDIPLGEDYRPYGRF